VSDFLARWDEALELARLTGNSQIVTHIVPCDCGAAKLVMAGRTMHPSFMAGPVVKHDPERDQ